MKKNKFLALFLAIAIALSMQIAPAYAVVDDNHCEKCKAIDGWTEWTGDATTIKAGGHFKLTTDVTVSSKIALGVDVCLDLAGNTISTAEKDVSIFQIGNDYSLTIMDSVGGGKIAYTGTSNRTVSGLIVANGEVNLYSGTLQGGKINKSDKNGGTVYMERATSKLNLYGGNITGGNSRASSNGGNIYASDGEINIYAGASVTDGKCAKIGGNIYVTNATVNLYGGTVTGGAFDATDTSTSKGKDIYAGAGSVVNVYAGQADSVYVDGGAVKIYNGTVGFENEASNVVASCACYTKTDNTYTVWNWGHDADEENGVCDCSFDASSVTLLTGEHDMVEGTCSICGFTAAVEEPELPTTAEGECEACDKNHTWNLWYADTDLAEIEKGGYWMLAESFQLEDQIDLAVNMCLDLNGQTLKVTSSTVNKNMFTLTGGTLNIMDSDNGGTLQGSSGYSSGAKKSMNGGIIQINNATVNLYSGRLYKGRTGSRDGSCVAALAGGTFNMYGGVVSDGRSDRNGGNLAARDGGVLNIEGGTISGGRAEDGYGDNIYVGKMNTNDQSVCRAIIKGGTFEAGLTDVEDIYVNAEGSISVVAGLTFPEAIEGAITGCAAAAWNGEDYKTFADLSEAIAYATADGRVDMGANGEIAVWSNNAAALHLNGNTLTVAGAFIADATNVTDSVGTGAIYATEYAFAKSNTYLPITDGTHVVLEKGSATVAKSQNNATSEIKKFGFYFDALKDNTKLDEAIADGTVKIIVKLLVNGEEKYEGIMAEKAGSVLAAYVADWNDGAILLKVTGVEVDDQVEVQIFVESNGALINYSTATAE